MPMTNETFEKEEDDWLHDPDSEPKLWAETKRASRRRINWRGLHNVGCVALLSCMILGGLYVPHVLCVVRARELTIILVWPGQ